VKHLLFISKVILVSAYEDSARKADALLLKLAKGKGSTLDSEVISSLNKYFKAKREGLRVKREDVKAEKALLFED